MRTYLFRALDETNALSNNLWRNFTEVIMKGNSVIPEYLVAVR